MASIAAKFKLVDEMSAKLDKIAQSGRTALSQWEKAGTAIDTAFDGAMTKTAQTAQSINTSIDAVEKFSESTAKAADKADEFSMAMNEMENAISTTSAASEEFASTEDKTDEALKGVEESCERAGKRVKDYGETSEDAGKKSKKFGDDTTAAIHSIEDLLITVGITKLLKDIGDTFVDCVEDAIEFESAITGVYKTVDGTPKQLAEISDEVKELSLRIPSTTTEIAAVAEAAGQLGIATDDVMSFTEVMINLGEATNLTSDEAASALAKFTNITGTAATEYENLGSTIVGLGNNFATTEADIVAMSTRMASAGTLAGMTESDILAVAASLSSVGIEADAGGSSVSTLISKMQLAVETGNDQLEQFASVAGYTADEFSKKWGEDAAQALYAFIDGLNDTERNGASATAVLDEMGITEIRLSNAIKALANNSDSFGEAITFANSAWEKNTALATEANTRYATLESKLAMTENAATNLSTAIGDVFTPTVSGAADIGERSLNMLTSFVKNNPNVVRGIASIAVGLGVATVAVLGIATAIKVADVATKAFTGTILANPISWWVVGIGAAVAALTTFAVTVSSAIEKEEEMSYATQVQKDKLNDLEQEYDRVCDKFGETSYQAQELKWQIDELSVGYDNNKQTMEEWHSEFEEYMSSHDEFMTRSQENIEGAELEGDKILNLATRLETLASKTDRSAAEQQEMLAVMQRLNEEVPGLSLHYDELSGKIDGSTDAVIALAEAEVARRKYEVYYDELIKHIEEKTNAEEKAKKAEDQYTVALEKQAEAQKKLDDLYSSDKYMQMQKAAKEVAGEIAGRQYAATWSSLTNEISNAQKALMDANEGVAKEKANFDDATNAVTEHEQAIEDCSQKMADLSGGAENAIENAQSVSEVIDGMSAAVADLALEYETAYEAAITSFEGQFTLFDEAKANMDSTVENAQKALDSQLSYWENYLQNVNILKETSAEDLGVTQENYNALMAYVKDGSAEAAGLAQSMVDAIRKGDSDAVAALAETIGKVKEKQTETAEVVAEWDIGFTDKMDEIVKKAEKAVNDLNLSAEATAAANATIKSYADEIAKIGGTAIANAKSIANQVKNALNVNASVNINTTTGKVGKGYATGTDYATAGAHLVGENGPEIVEFTGGEKVYTADETKDIFARSATNYLYSTEKSEHRDTPDLQSGSTAPKIIRLEIAGEGAIEIDENLDENTVVSIMQQYLKPVLTSIVKQEIYEEGDLSYDY